ncbi:MAG: hypothetical protein HYU36_03030 [Planctomycetes bacterium]|nr:hypothetical protein [Planctomycetota bacterium]
MFAYPILWREMLDLARRRRLWVYQLLYASLLSLLFLVIWPRGGKIDSMEMQGSGQAFLLLALWIQAGLALLLPPPLVAAALTSEKEQRSLDLLMLSPLGAGSIVATKCFCRIVNLGVVLASGLPVLMLGLFLGGVAPEQLLWGFAVILGLGLLAGCAGALCGALFPSFFTALVGSYALLGLLIGVIPLALSRIWPPAWQLLSPLGMIPVLLNDATAGNLPAGPGLILVLWTALAVLLVVLARTALLREVVTRTPRARRARSETPKPFPWRPLRTPQGWLMAWRELRGKAPDCSMIPLGLVLALYLTAAVLDLLLWNTLQNPGAHAAGVLGLGVAAVLFALFASTASLVRERRQGDLDLVLLSRLSAREVVEGKYRGILLSALPVLALPVLQAAVGPEPLILIPFILILLETFAPMAVLAGMEGGMRSDDFLAALGRAFLRCGILFLLKTTKLLWITIGVVLVGSLPLVFVGAFYPSVVVTVLAGLVFVLHRWLNIEVEVVTLSLSSQFSRGGIDTEWHGAEWEMSRPHLILTLLFWFGVVTLLSLMFGRLLGVFALFLLGAALAAASVLVVVWLIRTYREGQRTSVAEAKRCR